MAKSSTGSTIRWKTGKRCAGFPQFLRGSGKKSLATPSGKLEFYSESLAKAFPDDLERSPIPKWIEKSDYHDERMSNHGHWQVHAQCNDITWTREAPTCKVLGPGSYKYEPVWLHPSEAEKRGIQNGDIVKIFNERGIVLAGAYVTGRIRPGVIRLITGPATIPSKPVKSSAAGPSTPLPQSGYVQELRGQCGAGVSGRCARVTGKEMDQWRREHPEAFDRLYDPAAGLRVDAWIEKV